MLTLMEKCAHRKLSRDSDDDRIRLNKLKVSLTTELIGEVVAGANARSELRPIEKISGKKK